MKTVSVTIGIFYIGFLYYYTFFALTLFGAEGSSRNSKQASLAGDEFNSTSVISLSAL